jgi:methionyl-tRNA formyltransferase
MNSGGLSRLLSLRRQTQGPLVAGRDQLECRRSKCSVGIAKAVALGVAAAEPPGTVSELSDSEAVVATADELILIKQLWLDGRYFKPRELLAD